MASTRDAGKGARAAECDTRQSTHLSWLRVRKKKLRGINKYSPTGLGRVISRAARALGVSSGMAARRLVVRLFGDTVRYAEALELQVRPLLPLKCPSSKRPPRCPLPTTADTSSPSSRNAGVHRRRASRRNRRRHASGAPGLWFPTKRNV
jgi:hypothetical protein